MNNKLVSVAIQLQALLFSLISDFCTNHFTLQILICFTNEVNKF